MKLVCWQPYNTGLEVRASHDNTLDRPLETTHWFQPLKVYSRQLSSTNVLPETRIMPAGVYFGPKDALYAGSDAGGVITGGTSVSGAARDDSQLSY